MMDLMKKPFCLTGVQAAWVQDTLAAMTTEQKIGQLFCPCLFADTAEALVDLARRHAFGGMMFRPGSARTVQARINALQAAADVPLLIAANLEDGGNGLADEGTYMGRQMLIAATGDAEHAYRLGRICGSEGSTLGANWAFSPVVDIDRNDHNPITNVRTYGDDPDRVLAMGRAYIRGLTEEGLIPSIKHFPGDGVDERDQHLLTSVNSLSLPEWEASYGRIYRGLIADGAMTVMAAHIAMPAMEEYYDNTPCERVVPASCSKNVLRYLREELGFNGLIVTDASPMVGFTSAGKRAQMVPLCIEYGCDMLLFARDLEEDFRYMREGVRSGLLSQKRLDEAVTRILAVKAALHLPEQAKTGDLQRGADALQVLGCKEHMEWAAECADKAVTLVKDTQGLLPLDPQKHRRVLLELVGDYASNARVLAHFERRLTEAGFLVSRYVPETPETMFRDSTVEGFTSAYDLVLYIGNMENASNKTTARINWHTLFGAGNNLPWFAGEVPTLFVSVGNPYHLLDVPMIKTYINGYCHAPAVIDAVMDKLLGHSAFTGKSPVDPFCGRWDTRW